MIRPTESADAASVLGILRASGQFDADGLAFVEDTLARHLNHSSRSIWLTADDGEPVGVAYCAPEVAASGTWNLLMLWTRRDRQGQGIGTKLVAHLRSELHRREARLLIVETSSLPAFTAARSFYANTGFSHEATIKDFYAAGDDKMVFTKSLATRAA